MTKKKKTERKRRVHQLLLVNAKGEVEPPEQEGRNKQWDRDGTKMVWLRVTTEQRDKMDAAVRVWNASGRVVSGRAPKLTRTGLILDAVDWWLSSGPKQPSASGDQMELAGVKRG